MTKLNNLPQTHLKLLQKKVIQKATEATGELIGNKVTYKIAEVSRNSPQNSLETVKNETENIGLNGEIPKERYISPDKRQ